MPTSRSSLKPIVARKAKPSIISLYTGAGGLDLGFEAAGFKTRVAVEFDQDAVRTLRHNREWPVIDCDIHSDRASSPNILQVSGLRPGDASLLIGGPPCQPFSKSGYWAKGDALRLADPRASTLGAYLRVLRDTLPQSYLIENVPGLAFSSKDEGLEFLRKEIQKINQTTGTRYSFTTAVLRAVEFGVPQDRQRVFIVGHREGLAFEFPQPTHRAAGSMPSLFGSRDLPPVMTAWDAIGDLENDDSPELALTGKWADLLMSIPEGKNYLHHTDRGAGLPLFGWRRRYWSFLLKLAKNLPSWTIAAQPGPAIGPFHWKNRRLSPRELSRFQTFPDDYEVLGSLRAAQKQIGNAVPSALAELLGLEIRRQFFREKGLDGATATLLPQRRGYPPKPETVAPVGAKYRKLAGNHEAHPGTGKGYAATRRIELVSAG